METESSRGSRVPDLYHPSDSNLASQGTSIAKHSRAKEVEPFMGASSVAVIDICTTDRTNHSLLSHAVALMNVWPWAM